MRTLFLLNWEHFLHQNIRRGAGEEQKNFILTKDIHQNDWWTHLKNRCKLIILVREKYFLNVTKQTYIKSDVVGCKISEIFFSTFKAKKPWMCKNGPQNLKISKPQNLKTSNPQNLKISKRSPSLNGIKPCGTNLLFPCASILALQLVRHILNRVNFKHNRFHLFEFTLVYFRYLKDWTSLLGFEHLIINF